MNVKPAQSWITTNPVPLFINNTAVVVLALTNNVDIYATPVPGIPLVQTALDTLTTDQAATADGGPSVTVKRDNSRLVLANLVRQLAAYVTVACKGDLHNLILSGFPPQKTTRTPVGLLPAPQGLVLKQGALNGMMVAKANPVFGAATYNWTCTPNTPGAVPTVSCRGTVPVTPAGICRSTCNTPATKPGAAPAYRIWAACPPICAETGASGLGYTELLTPPSTPAGLVCPSPVAYSTRTPPAEAGFEAEFALPSRLVMAKIPGAVLTTGKVTVLVALPCTTTCITVLLFPATS